MIGRSCVFVIAHDVFLVALNTLLHVVVLGELMPVLLLRHGQNAGSVTHGAGVSEG